VPCNANSGEKSFVAAGLMFGISLFFPSQVFIKSELKVGVIYVKEGQYTEEEILDNNDNTPLFDEFLQILGDRVRLKGENERISALFSDRVSYFLFHYALGFDKYKGGLDTVHDLTGLYSVYSNWRGIEIMFHVSTQLPYEKHDSQKVGKCFLFTCHFPFIAYQCRRTELSL
jgi:RAP1 GTPase activating protein 1